MPSPSFLRVSLLLAALAFPFAQPSLSAALPTDTLTGKPPTPSSAPRPLTATLVSLAFCSLVIGPWASGITPAKPAASAPASPADTPPPASEALAKIIGRVAAAESRTARDWAELGRETVTWGGRLQSEQQPIPEGPVRDALAAVDAGAKLDAKTADWPKLREELTALLKKSEEQKQD